MVWYCQAMYLKKYKLQSLHIVALLTDGELIITVHTTAYMAFMNQM